MLLLVSGFSIVNDTCKLLIFYTFCLINLQFQFEIEVSISPLQ